MRRLILGFIALLLLASCGRERDDGRARPLGESNLDRPFVVFTQPEFLIQELEVPFAPPVAVGSTPSAATLTSSEPGVVSVRPDGALIGHRPGLAIVRAPGGAALRVEVVVPRSLTISAPSLLSPGDSAILGLLVDGARVDPARAVWATSDPKVANVGEGVVRAVRPGSARIRARYAGVVAEARVEVAGAGPRFSVLPANPRVSRGQVVAFQAVGERGSTRAAWSTGNARVLAQLGSGVFEGRVHGRTRVCAEASQQVVCTNVEVVP